MSIRSRGRPSTDHTMSVKGIKQVARSQMSRLGTAGLSLRGIARELGVTAPALYNYFSRLDDLITALIVDAFNGLADAMIGASQGAEAVSITGRIEAMTLAFRQWAVDHPAEYQLIYGNPIPGYEAPGEITVPLASRPFERLGELFVEGLQAGEIGIPAQYAAAPEPVSRHVAEHFRQIVSVAPPELMCLLASSWARFHGIILLEMFGHIGPVVGDPAAFYAYELKAWLRTLQDAAQTMPAKGR